VIALNGPLVYDINIDKLAPEAIKHIQNTPVFIYTGEADKHFKHNVAEFTFDKIKKIYDAADGDLKLNYHQYTQPKLGHEVDFKTDSKMSTNELQLIKNFIKKIIDRNSG